MRRILAFVISVAMLYGGGYLLLVELKCMAGFADGRCYIVGRFILAGMFVVTLGGYLFWEGVIRRATDDRAERKPIRLGGWQRVGIAASVTWMLGGTIFYHINKVADIDERVSSDFKGCYERRTQSLTYDGAAALHECRDISNERRAADFEALWADDLFVALVPVPIGWLAVYSLIGIFRWIRRGFPHSKP